MFSMAEEKQYLETIVQMLRENSRRQDEDLRRIEAKVDDNTKLTHRVHEQAKLTNGRVNNHDSQLKAIWKKLEAITTIKGGVLDKIDSKVWFVVALTILLLVAAGVGPATIREVKDLI